MQVTWKRGAAGQYDGTTEDGQNLAAFKDATGKEWCAMRDGVPVSKEKTLKAAKEAAEAAAEKARAIDEAAEATEEPKPAKGRRFMRLDGQTQTTNEEPAPVLTRQQKRAAARRAAKKSRNRAKFEAMRDRVPGGAATVRGAA